MASENKTAAATADMVFVYMRRSLATRVNAPGRNEDAIRGAQMPVKRGRNPPPRAVPQAACDWDSTQYCA
jgi:hypothetical protein